jgi:hypothetical protein
MEPDYPTKQPKDAVADALTDRNSDPDATAEAQDGSLKVHGDKLARSSSPQTGRPDEGRSDESRSDESRSDDGPPDGSRDEGF